jgi:hypothetical protein
MEITMEYNKVVLINLIDRKKDQKVIGNLFQTISKENKDGNSSWDFVWFDFHEECKKMQYQNLSRLLKITPVSEALKNFEQTHVKLPASFLFNSYNYDTTPEINFLQTQSGVYRVNCVDCLDRTNVVQTVFARQIVQRILYQLKITGLPKGDAFDAFHPNFESIFKNVWADNGDYLSFSYSGTKAMKGDFTRNGKKSIKGNIQDGIFSLKRYFINNFTDGYHQDCQDFALGKLNLKSTTVNNHSLNLMKVLIPVTLIIVTILYNFAISIALPKEYEDNNRKQLLRLIIFLGIGMLTTKTIFSNMKEKVIDKSTIDY